MIRTALAAFALLLSGCATRPAEVRVGFDATGVTSVTARGLADRTTKRRVNADAPVRLASISKLVTALGVMRLVEAGKITLDRDVSDWLGYRLRNPAFPDTPITLRLLLSHRSSLADGADYVIPLGKSLKDVLADPRAWDQRHAPGTWFAYTNLNFPVIAGVLEKATGERFDRLMTRIVFQPLGLDACFNWSGCSPAKIARHVVLYRATGEVALDDLHGQPPPCPVNTSGGCDLASYRLGDNGAIFSPQGGVRASMRDLARIGRVFLKNGDGFLSPASMATLTTPVWTYDGTNGDTSHGFYCRYGLATQTLPTPANGCADDLFGDDATWVGHAGEAYAVRSGLWIDRAKGRGVAFFATAVPDGSKGRSAFSREEERLARNR
ncbi:serine hydrolase domain-containing protein [Sphingomonas sp. EC-HK361]|uniref:serine hydrolase domain-containing protein n=1 Tax=Sphingomonas sp. EC-HK361 TaxID=2038397 RepID=UPI00125F87D5|nr:serine hydrolase domain-containing protein [Sphingomonas sp. EC-HK361]